MSAVTQGEKSAPCFELLEFLFDALHHGFVRLVVHVSDCLHCFAVAGMIWISEGIAVDLWPVPCVVGLLVVKEGNATDVGHIPNSAEEAAPSERAPNAARRCTTASAADGPAVATAPTTASARDHLSPLL
jgi:hypothetical protein